MAELVNMSDQFQGLPMDSLIGGPLTAACDSQIKLARATADFIKVIGFLPPSKDDPNGVGATRTAAFKFKRPIELPSAPGGAGAQTPAIGEEEVELEVPLLAIVNVPNLSITSVDITFDMEVKSSFSTTAGVATEASMSTEAKAGWGPFSAKVSVQGKVSAHAESTRKSDNSAKYHVAVHAEDRGMPEGLARVMDILQTSVAPRKISAPVPAGQIPEATKPKTPPK
ncbi:MAG: hypothetical protein BA864_08460 [Desulfuromonadales bacterium C00003093]|nr:MAG: hypothetical protein BA864_08460 [Desulfuromonadales bacterium C00003093]